MTGEIPFKELLSEGGAARAALASSWGEWAGVFCDGLLAQLERDTIEKLVLEYGAHFVSFGADANVCRINVRWTPDVGFTTYYGETLAAAFSSLWISRAAYYKSLKGPSDGQEHHLRHAGSSDESEILPWTG